MYSKVLVKEMLKTVMSTSWKDKLSILAVLKCSKTFLVKTDRWGHFFSFPFSFTYTLQKVLLRSDKLCTVGPQHRRAKIFSHHLESKEYV